MRTLFIRFLIKSFILLCLGSQLNCTTHFNSALVHFDKANAAYKNGQLGRSAKEYNDSLDVLKQAPFHSSIFFLRSSIYHQLYLINPAIFWNKLDASIQSKCPHIKEILDAHPQETAFPFLEHAFLSLFHDNKLLDTDALPREHRWLSVSRSIVIGDSLMQYSANSLFVSSFGADNFLAKITYYAYCELALNFYLDSWQKTTTLLNHDSSIDLAWLFNLSHLRVKETLWSLVSSSISLSQTEKNDELRLFFSKKSRFYTDMLGQLDKSMLPFSSGAGPSPASNAPKLDFTPDSAFMAIDFISHFQFSQTTFSSFLNAFIFNTSVSFTVLFDVFKHVCMAQFLSSQSTLSYARSLSYLSQDVSFYLLTYFN